jgi:hypothetical protein
MLTRVFASCGKLLGIGAAPTTVEEERRAWGRISSDVETTCSLAASASPERVTVRVRNISRGGINLDLAQAFHPGQLLRIMLPGGNAEEVSELLACVVRCRSEGSRHHVACTFAAHLSDDELMRFGGLKSGPPAPDQRGSVRFPCPAQAVVTVVGAAEEQPPYPAVVLNISASGIALETPVPRLVGELLSIELGRGEDRAVVTTLASVVRTTVQHGQSMAGCNFINELTEDQVRRLM